MARALVEGGEITQACERFFRQRPPRPAAWQFFSNEKGGPVIGPAFRTGTVIVEFQRC
jgi:hypothetical protein